MYKYVDQLNDHLKVLDHLDIFINSTIAKILVVNHLSSHFSEFQAQKQNTNLDKLIFDELFVQILQKNEIQHY